jgi:hypothetical protein
MIKSADALALPRLEAVLGSDVGEAPTAEKAFPETSNWSRRHAVHPGSRGNPRLCQELATVGYLGGCPVGPL